MNKKLRLRITNAISSTFNSCKPKHNTTATINSAQVFYLSPSNPKIQDIEFPTPPPPPRSSPSRRFASALVSTAGCKSCAPSAVHSPRWEQDMDDLSRARSTPGYLWRKEEKWLAVTSICSRDEFQVFQRRPKIDCANEVDDDDHFDDVLSSDVLKLASRRKREMETRRRSQTRARKSKSKSRNSTSSVASTGTWFSSEEDKEREEEVDLYYDEGEDTDTLLSSRSFSTDSSRIKGKTISSGCATAMLSKLCGGDEGKVKESFAVVKRSEDPRGDFRRSMAEMVVEKGIYEAEELEHLLHCFLSLNRKEHHGSIVSAFADIWEALFPNDSPHFGCDATKL